MKTSQVGINLIKEFESLHDGDLKQIGLQPKMCPSLIWTEGYGRAMRDDKGNFIKGIENKALAYSRITIHSEQQAIEALKEDLKSREFLIMQRIKVPLNQNQFDALVSFVYNTGGSDTVFRMVNKKTDQKTFTDWFTTHYITGGGKKLPGLIRRRKAECDLFFKDI